MHHLLAFLQLALRTLDEARLRRGGVVVARARERPTQLGDLASGLVDGYDVSGLGLRAGGTSVGANGQTWSKPQLMQTVCGYCVERSI